MLAENMKISSSLKTITDAKKQKKKHISDGQSFDQNWK